MSKGLKRAAIISTALVGSYALLGFLVVPGIALRIANQQLAHYSAVPAQLERIEFNPFSLELTVWGLKAGAPGAEQVGFERLYANLQVDSLWSGALHLTRVELDKPRTEVLFGKDGKLNLLSLLNLPPSTPDDPNAPASKPFPLRIDSIRLADGYVHFQDLRPSTPIDFVYDSLDLELERLSTLPEDNARMTLVAKGPSGGQIDWSGTLGLIPFVSEGHLKVQDARLQIWWPYVRDAVPLALDNGALDLTTDYKIDLSKGTELLLSNTQLKATPIALKTVDDRPLVRLDSLEVADASLDLAKQVVRIGKIQGQKLETWAAREADGELDWQKLFNKPAPVTPKDRAAPATASADTATPAPAATPGKPWQVLLDDVQLRGGQIHLADRVPKDPVALEVGPLDVDLKHFDSLNGQPFALKLNTGLGKQGKVSAEGEVNLAPVTAKLKVHTEDIDLRVAQSYITPYIRLELRSGMLGSDLNVALQNIDPLTLRVTGEAQVNQLHTLDTLKQRDFVKWQQLKVRGIDYQHGKALAIERLDLTQPYARFMINEDRTTNINDLLIPQPATAPAKPTASNPVAAGSASSSAPLGIRIGGVDIHEGSAYFADFSLTPNFATNIQQLNGQIGTIDNSRPVTADVDVKGKVDRYAPVVIHGHLTPFDPMASLDIATSFRRVELTTLTPYSGKFAGYRIRKGRLDLDLHYVITKGQLKAENELVVRQLQLGERVDSPDAVNLPIRLAVALLKDTEGKIAISLPVTGNLNDPQFSVMPIVWQTLRNLLARAVQAPFKMIGGLVAGGTDQDLSTVSFAPGQSDLDDRARGSLDKLAGALAKRPELRLEIEGAGAKLSDGPLLAQQRLEREYQATYYKILQRRGDKVPAQASDLTVPEDEKAPMLEGIYRTRLKQQPPAEWVQLERAERLQRMRDAVLGSWSDSPTLLRQLGQDRAASIKDYLVDKAGLDDERVYFVDAQLTDGKAGQPVDTSLQLDAE